jgi:hypothetical protein
MKGFWMIIMLLGLLAAGYLVIEDLKARQEGDAENRSVIEKTYQVEKKMDKASKAQEERLRNILGE